MIISTAFFFGLLGSVVVLVFLQLSVFSPFTGFRLIALLLAMAAVASLVGIFWKTLPLALRMGQGIFLFLVIGILLVAITKAKQTGAMHDSTNAPDAPPSFLEDKRPDSLFDTNIKEIQAKFHGPFPKIELPESYTFAELKREVEAQFSSWQKIHETDFAVQYLARSSFFRFEDDVVIYWNEGKPLIRSRSRVGEYDFGANASRVLQIILLLNSPKRD